MKVLYFTKYTRLGASSRLRSYQYFPYFKNAGISISVSPLFSDDYLKLLYSGKVSKMIVIKSYFKRFLKVFSVFKYDKLVIEKELFPYFPAWFEVFFNVIGIKYIVDYDDAIFHNYDLRGNLFIRFILRNKIERVMYNSECTIVGNQYLAERAKKAGTQNIEIIPTVIDISRYKKVDFENKSDIVIGWIGSPTSFVHVREIRKALKKIVQKYGVKIHIVGAKGELGFKENLNFIEWTEDSEITEIAKFNIGIMPLSDSPWERGKCAYKLIQYMGLKIPIVASPVGLNKQIIEEGGFGFLASTNEEWFIALEYYIKDSQLRKEHGLKGFRRVLSTYSIQKTNHQLINIIKG